MTNESRLLAEVIRRILNGSVWHITSDSWEGIKTVFSKFLVDDDGDWQVKITDENRNDVAQLIEAEDIAESTVHMDIESDNQITLFRSYDKMVFIGIDKNLYPALNPDNISADLEIALD